MSWWFTHLLVGEEVGAHLTAGLGVGALIGEDGRVPVRNDGGTWYNRPEGGRRCNTKVMG